ncbi:FHA domain-containing serine/threonine-protein kinase [Umezakia ovalisporum]|uniref:Serine/threonine-protein kinase n=2 Tax=Umezakia ovalisporum TaxID=75695 RepID=A0AA43GY55_9CYAN|nr:FHA domain-containing serine/threonine-protein kinase [Umezakia ovalisporum]MDH6057255.1 serine/threonine-protein kinase [Umezakia ovalisporum FSS-43]MDH6063625.1 serine/threonine-protein kinase [Umezakia ovalisporum FSS-62]MDH6068789.1 serine/threonine-protein kinase [Umezakia ovalisporum APH033B]MDH6070278.1 serine/threonine-protein kinase [Umezakia ovalisporum CobakiLakeA]MDH6076032.1 serine/threonine-protein kinase [Umezakia ovalisporum CS-1034]
MVILTLLEPQKTPLQQWYFENSSVIRIGRAVDNDVVLSDSLVSRHHLELRRVDFAKNKNVPSWQMISQGTNGTFVDGILVLQCNLADNCLLQLAQGGPILQFQLQDIPDTLKLSPQGSEAKENTWANLAYGCNHEGNSPNNLFCIHCGQPLSVQQKIRQYQVLRTLGQGGMGTTYLAWHAAGGIEGKPQLLVLKQMNADMAKIAKAQELFKREAHTLRSLHHSGIPKYYDFFVVDGKKYLAMELVHGQDLEKKVYATGPVTPSQAIDWMIQTCDILQYLHSQNPPLIHRDIKPANLMVRNSNNRIVVLDFGAVKEIGTTPGTRIGAEGYCAPEQERGKPLTQSDLYAIGPTLIFLLTGENPFKFHRYRGQTSRFDLAKMPTITPKLREVIERVTQHLPRDRYQNAQELAIALADCQV